MRILILALGSRGDVLPYVTLGQGLRQAGHAVRVATFESFAGIVTEAGVELLPIRGDAQTLTAMLGGEWMARPGSPLATLRALQRSFGQLTASLPEDLCAIVDERADLVLNQLPSNLFGPDLAEYFAAPLALLSVIPLATTAERPLFGFPAWPGRMGGAYHRLTYRLGYQVGWQMFRGAVNRLRARLGLRRSPFWGAGYDPWPVINGFSERVVPRPADWGENVTTTGWWQPAEPGWSPPAELLRFLENGPPPVFIGFGSMPVGDPRQMMAMVVEAARQAGVRVVLGAGWSGMGGELPPEVCMVAYAPYGWLFPRMAGVVHHGGSGTTGFALHSGVPSCVTPLMFDQFYWGERTATLGAGPRPLPFRQLSGARLAALLADLVHNPAYPPAAARLGAALRQERGLEEAVKKIESFG